MWMWKMRNHERVLVFDDFDELMWIPFMISFISKQTNKQTNTHVQIYVVLCTNTISIPSLGQNSPKNWNMRRIRIPPSVHFLNRTKRHTYIFWSWIEGTTKNISSKTNTNKNSKMYPSVIHHSNDLMEPNPDGFISDIAQQLHSIALFLKRKALGDRHAIFKTRMDL